MCEEACHWFKPNYVTYANLLAWTTREGSKRKWSSSRRRFKWQILSSGFTNIHVLFPSNWYHGILYIKWWFHKWSSTISDQLWKESRSLTSKSSGWSNGWHMVWYRGSGPIKRYQGQRSYKRRYSSTSGTFKWCLSNWYLKCFAR